MAFVLWGVEPRAGTRFQCEHDVLQRPFPRRDPSLDAHPVSGKQGSTAMTRKLEPRAPGKPMFLVIWWMSKICGRVPPHRAEPRNVRLRRSSLTSQGLPFAVEPPLRGWFSMTRRTIFDSTR